MDCVSVGTLISLLNVKVIKLYYHKRVKLSDFIIKTGGKRKIIRLYYEIIGLY